MQRLARKNEMQAQRHVRASADVSRKVSATVRAGMSRARGQRLHPGLFHIRLTPAVI